MRKENSANFQNESQIKKNCGMAYTLSVLNGRWKPTIIWQLLEYKTLRFSELKRGIEGISERVLSSQLRELEADQLIARRVYNEVPPRVEYELTELGLSMRPLLDSMTEWGEMHREKRAENDRADV